MFGLGIRLREGAQDAETGPDIDFRVIRRKRNEILVMESRGMEGKWRRRGC